MIRELERKATPRVWGGFLGSVTANIMLVVGGNSSSGSVAYAISGVVLSMAASVILLWGCSLYARAKGYSPWFGALGLVGLIGLIGLALLPDKHKDGLIPDANLPQTPTLPPPPPYHPGA